MKYIIVGAALSGFLLMGDGSATAGRRSDFPTLMTLQPDGSGRATGALGASRNSANDLEYIGCEVAAGAEGTTAACVATDAAHNFRVCFTSDPALIEVLKDMTSDAYVDFSWDAAGRCSRIGLATYSFNGPGLP